MAAQISDSQTSSNDQKSEIADLNKHLIEAAAEKDRLEAEVAYLKVIIFQDFYFKKAFSPASILRMRPGKLQKKKLAAPRRRNKDSEPKLLN